MSHFEKGMKVNFCHVSGSGNNFNFTTKTGEILLVKDKTVSIVCRKKLYVKNKADVTLVGEKTALTKSVTNSDNNNPVG